VATSSVEAARLALAAVREVFPTVALIHGEDLLQTGASMTDLDLAVGQLPTDWDDELRQSLARQDLLPVITWRYDSAAVSLFVASHGLQDGVQLDLLHSPHGKGKYGFLTDVALSHAVDGATVPSLAPIDSWLYQLRKRSLKGQLDRVAALLREAPTGTGELLARSEVLFAPGHRDVVREVLGGRQPTEPATPMLAELHRVVFRLRHPAGLWIHVASGEDQAIELHRLLGRFVKRATLVQIEGRTASPRDLRQILSVRWRAGAIVTWGPGGMHSDIRIESSDGIDTVCEVVRHAACVRAGRHLELLRRQTTW
jgi:hypothetical protein